MSKNGYTGISFPFRIGPQGGIVMSTTDDTDPTHIVEGLEQLFGTGYLQRVMESDVYTSLHDLLFEPDNESLKNLLKVKILEDIERLEERIEVLEDDMEFYSVENEDGNTVYVTLVFKMIDSDNWYTNDFKVGDI